MHLAIALLWSVAAAQGVPAPPPPVPLPTAKQVLDRYIEVTGGRAAHEKARHRTLTGTFEIKGTGTKGTLLLQQSAPDKMTTRIEIPGVGTIVKGTDGKHAWEVSAITGARLLEGAEKEEALLEAAFDADLRPERAYAKMETLRVEPVQGRPAYVVKLTPRGGTSPRTSFYDRESGRLVKFVVTTTRDMGTVHAESTVEDYRPEGGILLPHRVTLSALGMEQVLVFDTVSTAPVPEAAYAVPEEVQALLKAPPPGP